LLSRGRENSLAEIRRTFIYPKGSPHFPQRRVGILEQTGVNTIRFSLTESMSSVRPRQRGKQRLILASEFSLPLDMVKFSDSPVPEFFHSFRGRGEILPSRLEL